MPTQFEVEKYKELSLSKGNIHVYYFQYDDTIKGFYAIEKQKYYISLDIISQIFTKEEYLKLESKYIDVTPNLQKQFFLIKDENKNVLIDESRLEKGIKISLELILSNKKRGTPRKFIQIDKVNIQLETKNLKENYLEELN